MTMFSGHYGGTGVLDRSVPKPNSQVDPVGYTKGISVDLSIRDSIRRGVRKEDHKQINMELYGQAMWKALVTPKTKRGYASSGGLPVPRRARHGQTGSGGKGRVASAE
jgi:hypothetical protein